MKEILNDLKIMLTNNYTFTVLCFVLVGSVTFLPIVYVVGLFFIFPLLVYTLIHNITKVSFNHGLSFPDRKTSGWRLVIYLNKWFASIIFIVVLLFLIVSSLSGADDNTPNRNHNYLDVIIDGLLAITVCYFYVKNLSIFVVGLFPDTKELSWDEDLPVISQGIPNHVYYFVPPLAGIYYIDVFLGWTCIAFVCTAYTLRYVLGTPPQPRQKVKIMEICEDR